jgi:hypothetical protein
VQTCTTTGGSGNGGNGGNGNGTLTAVSDQVSSGKLSIYPNPSSDHFFVSVDEPCSYAITNGLGQVFAEGYLEPGVNKIKTRLVAGSYILQVQTQKRKSVTKIAVH